MVRVARGAGGVEVRIDAPPALSIARMTAGKPPEEAARLAGLVFNACSAAQEGAARAAFGLPPAPGAARRIAEEALRDHALKLALIWPEALGLEADRAALAAVPLIKHDHGETLSKALFGRNGPPRRLAEFEAWMATAETTPARVFDRLWRVWDSRWGRATPPIWRPGLPFVEVDWLEGEIDGRPVETSVAARVADDDLLREIEARRGRGILWRLAARIADAARLLEELPDGAPSATPVEIEPGLGAAPAARGTMLARGVVERGRVTQYARLSPTDCALHPHGLLAHVFDSLPRRGRTPLERVAAFALESVDPCLPYRLVMEDRRRG